MTIACGMEPLTSTEPLASDGKCAGENLPRASSWMEDVTSLSVHAGDCDIFVRDVLKVCAAANTAILRVYEKYRSEGKDAIELEFKGPNDPVTKADTAAHHIILDGLTEIASAIPVVSEEGEDEGKAWETRRHQNLFWCVDPLDGTREFLKRTDDFTVNIALVENGAPVLGVVSLPCHNRFHFAVRGQGAWSFQAPSVTFESKQSKLPSPLSPKPTALKCRSFAWEAAGLKVGVSRSHMNEATEKFVTTRLNTPILVPRGSSLKFLEIASGNIDVYPRFGPTMEWDTCAAHAILREAGGEIRQVHPETNELLETPLSYGKESLYNPYFIAHGVLSSSSGPAN